MASKIKNVERKYPVFSIIVNILHYNKIKEEVKISKILKNIFDNDSKSDEQLVKNIIESISEYGVGKKGIKILTKNKNIAGVIVNKNELIDYLFNLVGEYFIAPLESFYDETKFNKQGVVKKIIRLYLDDMSFKPEDVCEMTFSDAIQNMEQTIFYVSKHEKTMSKIKDSEVKDLIKKWSEKISNTMDNTFNEKPPFVE